MTKDSSPDHEAMKNHQDSTSSPPSSSSPSSSSPRRGKVVIHDLGPLKPRGTPEEMKDWPNNMSEMIDQMIVIEQEQQQQQQQKHKTQPQSKHASLLPSTDAATVWQAAARVALLRKYGIVPNKQADEWMTSILKPADTADTDADAVTNEVEMVEQEVLTQWHQLVDVAAAAATAAAISDNASPPAKETMEPETTQTNNDLLKFVQAGGKSHGRTLQWALMDCAPSCQFRLHAHPNIELVYCLKGELHEIRMSQTNVDDVLTKTFTTTTTTTITDKEEKATEMVVGPSLQDYDRRPWDFRTLRQGEWLVNEVGSIHKSFTATNGQGCLLWVLWGGSHADIVHESTLVTSALDRMDVQLTEKCGCHPTDSELEAIAETFLPDSEKATASSSPSRIF